LRRKDKSPIAKSLKKRIEFSKHKKRRYLMLEQLIVPEDLMTAPATATHEVTLQYSHEDQKAFTMQGAVDRAFDGVDFGGVETAQTMTFSTSTFAGTQTYDYKGRPNDSDTDSDCSGDC